MFGWLFGTDKKKERPWTVIYAEDGVSASLNDSRNIPRWLRKRVLNLERIEPNEYYVFKGKRYEYRVSFTVNQGHGRVLARARRK